MGFFFQNIRLFSETIKRTNLTGPFTFNRKEAKIDYHFILFFSERLRHQIWYFWRNIYLRRKLHPVFCSFRMKKKMERLKKFTVTWKV